MTRRTIRMRLSDAINYLNQLKSGNLRKRALSDIKDALLRSIFMNVYVYNLDNVYEIWDATEMRRLMLSGGAPRKGSYNLKYKKWKKAKGLPPHEISGRMKASTKINVDVNKVSLSIPTIATTRTKKSYDLITGDYYSTSFNFGPIHERRKSVLKATFVFAWHEIKRAFRDAYEP